MTTKEQVAAKAEKMEKRIIAIEQYYEDNNVPEEERLNLRRLTSAEQIAKEAEDNLRKLGAAIAEEGKPEKYVLNSIDDCKLARKFYLEMHQNKQKTSLRVFVKNLLEGESDDNIEKTFGGNEKAVLKLLEKDCDWCKNTYEKLKIGQIVKTCYVFALYRWREEGKTRMTTVTGMLSKEQIATQTAKECANFGSLSEDEQKAEIEKWTKKHYCEVLVNSTSPSLLNGMFNEHTLIGVVSIEGTLNAEKVIECIQYEFGYRKFLEAEKCRGSILTKEEKQIGKSQIIRPKTAKAHKAAAAEAAKSGKAAKVGKIQTQNYAQA